MKRLPIIWRFKPHIVQWHRGSYVIRKSILVSYVYLDASDLDWWITQRMIKEYCVFADLGSAQKRLEDYHRIGKPVLDRN